MCFTDGEILKTMSPLFCVRWHICTHGRVLIFCTTKKKLTSFSHLKIHCKEGKCKLKIFWNWADGSFSWASVKDEMISQSVPKQLVEVLLDIMQRLEYLVPVTQVYVIIYHSNTWCLFFPPFLLFCTHAYTVLSQSIQRSSQ